jgi:hypothetical protein
MVSRNVGRWARQHPRWVLGSQPSTAADWPLEPASAHTGGGGASHRPPPTSSWNLRQWSRRWRPHLASPPGWLQLDSDLENRSRSALCCLVTSPLAATIGQGKLAIDASQLPSEACDNHHGSGALFQSAHPWLCAAGLIVFDRILSL